MTLIRGGLNAFEFALPGCSSNREYARVAKQNGGMLTVPVGAPCPTGYKVSTEIPGNGTVNTLCDSDNISPSDRLAYQSLASQTRDCYLRTYGGMLSPAQSAALARAPAQSSALAPPLVCEYCKCPRGSGRVDPGCPGPQVACANCLEDYVLQVTPIPPSSPVPGPTMTPIRPPPLVCEHCACPPGSGRVDPGCPPNAMACIPCSMQLTPAPAPAPAPTPGPAPAPGPETKSELPIWAIILIVILVFLVAGGVVYQGIKMSQ